MSKIVFPATINDIRTGVDYIEEKLRKGPFSSKQVTKTMLLAEEALVRIISQAYEGENISLSVYIRYGVAHIRMICRGQQFVDEHLSLELGASDLDDPFNEENVRSLLLHAFKDNISYERREDYNYIELILGDRERVFIKRIILGIVLGIILSLVIVPVCPDNVTEFLINNILLPVQTIYLNALQLITAPAVFFSLMVTIARYRKFSDPSYISKKVVTGYLITTCVALFLGLAAFKIVQPLLAPLNGALHDYVSFGSSYFETTSILNIFINSIPTNIIAPFLNVDGVQLLLIAAICGIAVGKTGVYKDEIMQRSEALNKFFTSIVDIVSYIIPIATFFSVILLITEFGIKLMLLPLILVLIVAFGVLLVVTVYMLAIAGIAHINPFIFIKKYWPLFKETMFGGSSVAMVYDNINFCTDKLGIGKKVSSLAIPLGAVANMDGNCIYLIVADMFLAQICGVDIMGSNLIKVLIITVLLSIGAPSAPGGVMVFLTLIMNQMGISIAVISLLLVVNSFIELFLTAFNTLGDIAIAIAVADITDLLDKDVYNYTGDDI